jgi:hypothetical protein
MAKWRAWAAFALLLSGCRSDKATPPPNALSPWEQLERARGEVGAGAVAVDLDGDGRKELTRVRDPNGKVIREEIDLDGDARADLIWQDLPGGKSFRADVDHDGVAEQAWEVTFNPLRPTITDHVFVRDSDGDGKPDLRLSYTVDANVASFEVRVESARADGTWDLVRTFETSREQAQETRRSAIRFQTNAADSGYCDDAAQARLRQAYRDALDVGLPCLAGNTPALAAQLRFVLAHAEPFFSCYRSVGLVDSAGMMVGFACATAPHSEFFIGAGTEGLDIPINVADIFWDEARCSNPSSTVFHELMHYALGVHVDNPLEDAVYGCQAMCFGCPPSLRNGSSCNIPVAADAIPQCRRAEPLTESSDGQGLCFVGDWTSGAWTVPELSSQGGNGITLTLRADGTGHANFGGMQPVVMTQTDGGGGTLETRAYYRGEGGVTWSAAEGFLSIRYDDLNAFQTYMTSRLDGVVIFDSMESFADALTDVPLSTAMYRCVAGGWRIVSSVPGGGGSFEMPFTRR